MMAGCVVREIAGLCAQRSYKVMTWYHISWKTATGERGEVAVGDQTSGWCCGFIGNEQMPSTVFSCGMQGS
jgi:hypothetical protein